jgi:hypothetical protein
MHHNDEIDLPCCNVDKIREREEIVNVKEKGKGLRVNESTKAS